MKHSQSKSPWHKPTIGVLALVVTCLLPAYRLAEASPPTPASQSTQQGRTDSDVLAPSWIIGPSRSEPGVTSFECQSYDVRKVLILVFQHFHVSYRIDPNVHGKVTLSVQNVNLNCALDNITRQVNASCALVKGVYVVTNQPQPNKVGQVSGRPSPTFYKDCKITVEYKKVDVRTALRDLFGQSQRNYAIEPTVQGYITISIKDMAFDEALRRVLKQVSGDFKVQDGVYVVGPKDKPPLD